VSSRIEQVRAETRARLEAATTSLDQTTAKVEAKEKARDQLEYDRATSKRRETYAILGVVAVALFVAYRLQS
jgi:hypothetical protein